MKTMYIECNMGAAGDMLFAALLELHPNPDEFLNRFNNLKLPNVNTIASKSTKCGIVGTKINVLIHGQEEHTHQHQHEHQHEHEHTHSHVGMKEIEEIINTFNLSDKVKMDIKNVYSIIADAESKAHNKPVSMIHFHEVGMMDAIADVTATCMLINEIDPEKIITSPIHVGIGNVKCAHGILPVPAPATANILKGIPIYSTDITGELCTPTGAALIKYFAHSFGPMPILKTEKIGLGMGTKDFPLANCVRIFLGETEKPQDYVCEITCSLDDITSEEISFAQEILLENNALDVYITSIYMKKNRPAFNFTCICKAEDEEKMVQLILKHTTTLGVRCNTLKRYTLERSIKEIETKYGTVNLKLSSGYNIEKNKIEFDDLTRLAKENNMSIFQVKKEIIH